MLHFWFNTNENFLCCQISGTSKLHTFNITLIHLPLRVEPVIQLLLLIGLACSRYCLKYQSYRLVWNIINPEVWARKVTQVIKRLNLLILLYLEPNFLVCQNLLRVWSWLAPTFYDELFISVSSIKLLLRLIQSPKQLTLYSRKWVNCLISLNILRSIENRNRATLGMFNWFFIYWRKRLVF